MENTMPVHVIEFDKICRTCLSTEDILPLFALMFESRTPIVNLLDSCASVHVEKDDGLPQNLCSICVHEIIKIHQFQEKCRENQSLLRFTLIEQKIVKQEIGNEIIKQNKEFEMVTNYSDSEGETNKIVETDPLPQEVKLEKTFPCPVCSEEFASKGELKEHQKEAKHQEVRKRACSVCGKMCVSSKLKRHMRVHTNEKPHKCSVCSKGFGMRANLKRHMLKHTDNRPYVCEFCGKGFTRADYLQIHLRTHSSCERTDSVEFVCSVCGRSCKGFTHYSTHLKEHDVDKLEEKEKKLVVEGMYEHSCEAHGDTTFLCGYCGKGFVVKVRLQSHLKVHTGEKPHTCNICKKSFAHLASYNVHMLLHTGQKPHKCNICGKTFRQGSNLKGHMLQHTGEKPYNCTHCGKKFRLKGNLTVHIRLHTGEKPYICSLCGKGFYNSSNMRKHQRTSHGTANLQSCDVIARDLKK